MIHEVNGWEEDDDQWDVDDEDDFCPTCQGRGYIPAMDFESIEGHEGWACPDCDRGVNSNFPYRPSRKPACPACGATEVCEHVPTATDFL